MVDLLTDVQTVKATTDRSGLVWLLRGCAEPKPTGLSVAAFVAASPSYAAQIPVRVPGLAHNTNLLLRLYAAQQDGRAGPLEVCSPRCCGPEAAKADPAVLLYSMRSFSAPISTGGWRSFDELDASALRFVNTRDPDWTRPPMLSHPAGPCLAWIDDLCEEMVSSLLGLIVDPRWFIDPAEPDRTNKLFQFLGLDPGSQQGRGGARAVKNLLVLSCWKTTPPPELASLKPWQFLWRTWHAKGGGWKGDLAASKRFVSFLRQSWLFAVCRGGLARELLVPELFFQTEEEAASFSAHRCCL